MLFLIWQISTLFYKDKWFKDTFCQAKWLDKLKVLFTWITDLNKKLFADIFEYDYTSKFESINDYLKTEKDKIENNLDEILDKLNTFKHDKLMPILWDLEQKALTFKKLIEEKITDINEKYELQKKIETIIEKINNFKNHKQ